MNITKYKLSTILLLIAAIGGILALLSFIMPIRNFAIIGYFCFATCFPAGLIVLRMESHDKNPVESSTQTKIIRNLSIALCLCSIVIFILIAYSFNSAWSGG